MARITVAELAEIVAKQGEALDTLVAALANQPKAAPQPEAPQATEGVLVPIDEAQVQPKAAADISGSVELARQSDRSRGGALRFWGGDEDGPHGAVYVIAEPSAEPKGKTVKVTYGAEGTGMANLAREDRQNGRPKTTKGRLTYSGTFQYGGATVKVFVNVPKVPSSPKAIGFNLTFGS